MTTYTRDGSNRITRIDYQYGAYETYDYNGYNQVITHRRKNGAYDYADYAGYLIRVWEPTTSATRPDPASSTFPKTTYLYYPAGDPWAFRVKCVIPPTMTTVTPPTATAAATSAVVAGDTLTYEYDRLANGTACSGRGLVTKIGHSNGTQNDWFNTYQTFGYDQWGNKSWEENEL